MEQLLVADSFRVRVRDGRAEVRGLGRHVDRFARAVLETMPGAAERDAEHAKLQRAAQQEWRAADPEAGRASFIVLGPTEAKQRILDRVDAFLEEALPRIAAYGEGFPRLELWGGPKSTATADAELRLSLRPLPELRDRIELRTAGRVRLESPGRKGPNIARLAELNRELGAEALLLDRRGRALEGATTSLIWWTDDTDESGHLVEQRWGKPANRVESVTESLLQEAAQKRLVGAKPHRQRTGPLSSGRLRPAELARFEVWAVNALHGIRVVTSIDGSPQPAPHEQRLRWFREALDRAWEPII